MYTWEIIKFFEDHNYEIDDYEEFYKIQKSSPQIRHIKLEEIQKDKAKYLIEMDDFKGYFWVKNKRE